MNNYKQKCQNTNLHQCLTNNEKDTIQVTIQTVTNLEGVSIVLYVSQLQSVYRVIVKRLF